MGPIERELRQATDPYQFLSAPAFHVALDAMWSLYRETGYCSSDDDWPDIMSEAIEAAEALGL